MLANCVKKNLVLNSHTETMESELPNFSLNLDFGNFENETRIRLKINLFFIHQFLPHLSAFVDSYYSPSRPLSIMPGRFYYRNTKF